MQNAQDKSELGKFRFKQVPGDDELPESVQYFLDFSGVDFSDDGLYSITIMENLGRKIIVETEDGKQPEKFQLTSDGNNISFSTPSNFDTN
ncbi:unnamed protein product [Ambrosiozyma monospora]|uniref:Unnamed protein product n=1 Tax=Ambrosiozyma monospora TaxID=43982 RepID=A0A9W7DMS0_AMBMO|nr:unnamed protein product [Ambrosiozyma monospora]